MYANPNNPSLLNNLAFSLASKGNVRGALDVMSRIDKVSEEKVSRPERIALTATKGLIYYKVGSIEYARNLYKEAIEQAGEIGNKYLIFAHFKIHPMGTII